jgi:hemerythrin-like metal-binding protein
MLNQTAARPMQRIVFVGFILFVGIVLAAGFYSIYITNQHKTIKQELALNLHAPTYKALLLSELRDNLGYGGFIHNFKNYVLRGESAYLDGAVLNHDEALRLVNAYRETNVSPQEEAALNTIAKTLKEYSANLDLVQRLYAEKAEIEAIDAVAKISDVAAIAALVTLENQWSALYDRGAIKVTKIIEDVEHATKIVQGTIALVLILSMILAFWVLRLQRSMVQLVKELHEARDRAEQANRFKSEFLASMSHELRTPLNAVLGYGQFLQLDIENQLSDAQQKYIEHMITGGNHLLELVNDILDLAKIEASKMSVNVEKLDAEEIVNDCVSQSAPLSQNRNISITNELRGDSGIEVFSDKLRLKQIITNILSNAIKYNKEGGTVIIRGEETKDRFFRLSVADTGIGIPEYDRVHVFDVFQRSNLKPELATEGSGIGLSVTKMLVERLAGRIGFDSEVGEGSTFWIEIPLLTNVDVLIWTDAFRVGIDPIDKDHQIIALLYNRMLHDSAAEMDVSEAFEQLIDYTHYHFRREEAIMRVCDYPDLETHKKQHKNLISKVAEMSKQERNENLPAFRLRLRKLLRVWLKDHILKVDNIIAVYAKGKEIQISTALRAID